MTPLIRIILSRPGAGLAVLLVVTPALAQAPGAPLPAMQNARSFQLRNLSHHTIEQATATMTGRTQKELTSQGPVRADQATNIVVPKTECLAGVDVKFNTGRSLHLGPLRDCRVTKIIVWDDHIQTRTSAAPGHGSNG